MPSFLRKHLGAAKRKIRDTVIETKTQYVSRIIRKQKIIGDNTNQKPMFERHKTRNNL